MAASTMSLKLLIDAKGQRVLFAEAGKDFVDFLFGILTLPMGSIIGLYQKHELETSLTNLYDSIQNLNESCLQSNQTKSTLLKPEPPLISGSSVPLLGLNDAQNAEKCYYTCNCMAYASDDQRAICPECNEQFPTKLAHVAPPVVKHASGEGGYVKGVITYMVMDNLAVTPLSTISCFTLLRKFDINDMSVLEEKVVDFGMKEAMKLLSASFNSKMVLSDVFLKGMK